MKPYKLLLTARDTGAALQLAEVARQAKHQPLLNIVFYAAQPAAQLLTKMGINIVQVNTPVVNKADGHDYQTLLNAADEILNETKPDAILTGLSGHGAGIDEAIILRATDIPSYTFQDYWGDVNHVFDKVADCYFTLDDTAARLTQQRFKTDTCISGSVKHAAYAQYDSEILRNSMRCNLGIRTEQSVIGLFGQPIQPQANYLHIIERVANTVQRLPEPPKLVYRPHPNDSQETTDKVLTILTSKNIKPINVANQNIVPLLCSCDFVCSAFSSCNLDNIYLNYFSPSPLGLSAYLFLSDSIEQTHLSQSGLSQPPPIEMGFAAKCSSEEDLFDLFSEGKSRRKQYWRQIKEGLPSPEKAVTTIIEKIFFDLR